jgi:hypothetical protein
MLSRTPGEEWHGLDAGVCSSARDEQTVEPRPAAMVVAA